VTKLAHSSAVDRIPALVVRVLAVVGFSGTLHVFVRCALVAGFDTISSTAVHKDSQSKDEKLLRFHFHGSGAKLWVTFPESTVDTQ
jgi:hypothetical protein